MAQHRILGRHPFRTSGKRVSFQTDFLEIVFTGVGIEGSCPAKKDNDGCYFIGNTAALRRPDKFSSNKEFCDCSFRWEFTDDDACGISIGKTLPAHPEEVKKVYPKKAFTVEMRPAFLAGRCLELMSSYLTDSLLSVYRSQISKNSTEN